MVSELACVSPDPRELTVAGIGAISEP